MYAPDLWWAYARTAERVAKDTSERHVFNSAAVYVGVYAEAECYIKLGDGAVTIGAFNEADTLRVPAGVLVKLSLVDYFNMPATSKTKTAVAFRAPVACRVQFTEWDNPSITL